MNYITAEGEIVPLEWKTPFNHNTRLEAERTATTCLDPTKAQQHGKEEADINTIVNRFLKTGLMPQVPVPPTYQAFGEIFDFQSAMNTVKAAQDSFAALPANIRSRFDNDPAKFVGYVDHCLDNEDIEPLREMGLAIARKAPEPKPEQTGGKAPEPPQDLQGGPKN